MHSQTIEDACTEFVIHVEISFPGRLSVVLETASNQSLVLAVRTYNPYPSPASSPVSSPCPLRVLSRVLSVSSPVSSPCPLPCPLRVLSRVLSVSSPVSSPCPLPCPLRVLSRVLSVSSPVSSPCPLHVLSRVPSRVPPVSSRRRRAMMVLFPSPYSRVVSLHSSGKVDDGLTIILTMSVWSIRRDSMLFDLL